MKIKLAILENDVNYLNRIVNTFNNRYSDKIEVFGFSDSGIVLQQLQDAHVDVFMLAEEQMHEVDFASLKAVPLIMVTDHDIRDIDGYDVVSKYQKVDLIYKKILAVYSAHTNYSFAAEQADVSCTTMVYTGIAGGVGTTAVALGTAFYLAKQGKRVMYLDFNRISEVSSYLSGEGTYSMSDILYAIKSKKSNIGMKIESVIRKDMSGVDFIKEADTILDMMEMTTEEAVMIWQEICRLEHYDYVLIDMPFSFDGNCAEILPKAQRVIWVSDGSAVGNNKMIRTYQAVKIVEEQNNKFNIPKLGVVYNRFSSRSGKIIENIGIKNLGGVPKVENATERQVVEFISNANIHKAILEE